MTIHWKDWCLSWSSNTLATWCKETTHWKRCWCWERLRTGEGDDRGWDGSMALPTQWTWIWASSGRWWRTGKPSTLHFMGSQRDGHDLLTEWQIILIIVITWGDIQSVNVSDEVIYGTVLLLPWGAFLYTFWNRVAACTVTDLLCLLTINLYP